MADDTRTLLAQNNTYSDDAVILRQEANKFIGEDITVTLETNRAIVEGSAGGGAGIVASFVCKAKVDDTYQGYDVLALPFIESTGDIILRDDDITIEAVRSGRYNLLAITGLSGGGSTGTTVTIYKNDEILDTFRLTQYSADIDHPYELELEAGDTIKIYNNRTGWQTLALLLFFRG